MRRDERCDRAEGGAGRDDDLCADSTGRTQLRECVGDRFADRLNTSLLERLGESTGDHGGSSSRASRDQEAATIPPERRTRAPRHLDLTGLRSLHQAHQQWNADRRADQRRQRR